MVTGRIGSVRERLPVPHRSQPSQNRLFVQAGADAGPNRGVAAAAGGIFLPAGLATEPRSRRAFRVSVTRVRGARNPVATTPNFGVTYDESRPRAGGGLQLRLRLQPKSLT
jgi:hypothetical protein